jgi:hypothetical protein
MSPPGNSVAQSTIKETPPYSYWHVSPTGHVGEMGHNVNAVLRTEPAARKTEPSIVVDVDRKLVKGRSWLGTRSWVVCTGGVWEDMLNCAWELQGGNRATFYIFCELNFSCCSNRGSAANLCMRTTVEEYRHEQLPRFGSHEPNCEPPHPADPLMCKARPGVEVFDDILQVIC